MTDSTQACEHLLGPSVLGVQQWHSLEGLHQLMVQEAGAQKAVLAGILGRCAGNDVLVHLVLKHLLGSPAGKV